MISGLIQTEEALDEILTRPTDRLVQSLAELNSPLLILGAGGKMGPSLAVLAKRTAEKAGIKMDVIAASRFSNSAARKWLRSYGVQTYRVDLLDPESLKQLPDVENIIYLVGQKFGTTSDPQKTWVTNTIAPANACERFRSSRIVALSTGSIYPFTPVAEGGATETHPLNPIGEYANACMARERIFEFYSRQNGTPVVLIRLFYAVEMRYGVLVDIASKVHEGGPIDLTMGYLNWIWQGDANEMILRSFSLADTPPSAYNLTGTKAYSIRELVRRFGRLLEKPVLFSSSEADNALLGNSSRLFSLLGKPGTPDDDVIRWTAGWIQSQGKLLGKATHFDVRDGKY